MMLFGGMVVFHGSISCQPWMPVDPAVDPLTFFWDDDDVEWTSSRETGPIDMINDILGPDNILMCIQLIPTIIYYSSYPIYIYIYYS